MVWVAKQSFATGEISPSVYGMVSTSQYQAGCMELVNALLTPTGAARKRYGTQIVTNTTGNNFARLFFYYAKGRQYVVQFVSAGDDAADTNTPARQLRVMDAATQTFVDFGDNAAHGPFSAFGDGTAYYHNFTATELRSVYSFQDSERIYFMHPDKPAVYLERQVQDPGSEAWEYGLYPKQTGSPVIIDYRVGTPVEFVGNTLTTDSDFFVPDDNDSYWRVMGANAADPVDNPWGNWVQVTRYKSRTDLDVVTRYGGVGPDSLDWTGPYTPLITYTGTAVQGWGVNSANLLSDVTLTGPTTPAAKANWTGFVVQVSSTTFAVDATILGVITYVNTSSSVEIVRLQNGNGIPAGDSVEVTVYGIAANSAQQTVPDSLLNRSYLKKLPVYVGQARDGAGQLIADEYKVYSPNGYLQYYSNPTFTDSQWLPAGHATTYDRWEGNLVGGGIHINGGIVAITGVDTAAGPDGDEVVYDARIVKPMAHQGPSMQWGLTQSHGVGFPSCGASHQGRIWMGGYKEKPGRVVASRVYEPEDFTAGGLDSDGISADIADSYGGSLTWMASASDLLIGTATGEYAIGGRPITPANLAVEKQSSIGSRNVRPPMVDNAVIFTDAAGKGLREMVFRDDANRYQSPDLTDLAKHLFEDIVIEQLSYVGTPGQALYAKDTQDRLYALSMWRANNVTGWSRLTQPSFPTTLGTASEDSTIESITTVRGDGIRVQQDELWIVRRWTQGGQTSAGTVVRTIERMTPEFAMDMTVNGSSLSGTGLNTGSNLIDLPASKPVQVMVQQNAGGPFVYIGDYAVDSQGVVTHPEVGFTPNASQAGRAIPFKLTPTIPHFMIPNQGDSQGRLESVSTLIVLIRESIGGKVAGNTVMPPGVSIPNATSLATPVSAVTEWRKVVSVGTYGTMHEIPITHELPYHFEVAGLNFQLTHGR